MNIIDLLSMIFKSLISVVKMLIPLTIPVIILIVFILLSFIFNLLYLRVFKGMKRRPLVKRIKHQFLFEYKDKKYCLRYITEEPFVKTYKEDSIFKKILVKMPRQLAIDSLERDPNSFQEFGIHMFCGHQGSGKTVSAIYLLNKWRQLYPNLEIYSNIEYEYRNGSIEHWKQLIERTNGIYGVANFLDEIYSWLQKKSGNVPFSLLNEISQQRKQKKAILGTAQVFGKLPKEIRDQCDWVYLPRTFFGCFTIVRKAHGVDYIPDKNKFRNSKFAFMFVHDKKLRNAYDTYERVERYIDDDFKPNDFISAEG